MRHLKKPLKFYSDPGHGWLAVKRAALFRYVSPQEISSYSYQRGKTVYLEEDCDASRFIAAFKARHGNPPAIIEKLTDRNSPIRNYEPYKVPTCAST